MRTAAQLKLTALEVGHGDATLIQWEDEEGRWTCLVDGGTSPRHLAEKLRTRSIEKIDLLVASHIDSDHIGGFEELAGRVQVLDFWGPALPAFERHSWLFGTKCQEAVRRARAIEEDLLCHGVHITYPLEGYTLTAGTSGDLEVQVLSPPGRIVRTLLTEHDVGWLFSGFPTPLGWLAVPEEEFVTDEFPDLNRLRDSLASFALSPEDIPARFRQPTVEEWSSDTRLEEWSKRTRLDPEFFGDSLLNNTSLVLWLGAKVLPGARSVVLPGDQENWTYLLARHPRGFRADVLKASHHGGRMYIESQEAVDEILSQVRPRAITISANGQHVLPRSSFRECAVRWGASVFCTSRRGIEVVCGGQDKQECCHQEYRCRGEQDVVLVLDGNGIRGETTACHSGRGSDPGSVIEIRQHVIEPSPVVLRLAEHELRRHVLWLGWKLRAIHDQRASKAGPLTTGSSPLSEDQIGALATADGRASLADNVGTVLEAGYRKRKLWSRARDRYRSATFVAYAWPKDGEVTAFVDLLAKKLMIFFPTGPARVNRDPESLVTALETAGLARYLDATMHFPEEMFRDAFWPAVVAAFASKSWHCYEHASGSIAISRISSVSALLTEVLRRFLTKESGKPWLRVQREHVSLSGIILPSGVKDKGEFLGEWEVVRYLESWLKLQKSWHEKKSFEELVARVNDVRVKQGKGKLGSLSWDVKEIDCDDVLLLCKNRVDKMVAMLGSQVTKLW